MPTPPQSTYAKSRASKQNPPGSLASAAARGGARSAGGSFTFDSTARRYRDRATGRYVPETVVRGALDAALGAVEARTRGLTTQLRDGAISLDEWYAGMRVEVKAANLYGAAAAAGGWDRLTAADFGRVGQRIRQEYEFLRQFAEKLSAGTLALDGNAVGYAGQYAQAGRSTYYAVLSLVQAAAGLGYCSNVRVAKDSCSGCLAAEALGIVPIAQMPPVGTRTCRRACRCFLRYYATADG